jgi:hypothetical protein
MIGEVVMNTEEFFLKEISIHQHDEILRCKYADWLRTSKDDYIRSNFLHLEMSLRQHLQNPPLQIDMYRNYYELWRELWKTESDWLIKVDRVFKDLATEQTRQSQIDFDLATKELHRIFGRYQYQSHIFVSPFVCDGLYPIADMENITLEKLGYYAFKAMTTMGDTNNFKYYLPLILKTSVNNTIPICIETVGRKFVHGDYREWLPLEQQTIQEFLLASWQMILSVDYDSQDVADTHSYLCMCAIITGNIQIFLDKWYVYYSPNSLIRLMSIYLEPYLIGNLRFENDLAIVDQINKFMGQYDFNTALETIFFQYQDNPQVIDELNYFSEHYLWK